MKILNSVTDSKGGGLQFLKLTANFELIGVCNLDIHVKDFVLGHRF